MLVFSLAEAPLSVSQDATRAVNLLYCRSPRVKFYIDELLIFICDFQEYPEGTIVQNGLSKWASAGGWRLGYQIYPPCLTQLMMAVRSASSHTHSCASAPIQYAALEYYR